MAGSKASTLVSPVHKRPRDSGANDANVDESSEHDYAAECHTNPNFDAEQEEKDRHHQELVEQRRGIDQQYSKKTLYATDINSYKSALADIIAEDKAQVRDVLKVLDLLEDLVENMHYACYRTIDGTTDDGNFEKFLFGNQTRVGFLELLGYYFDEQDPTKMTCNALPPVNLRQQIAVRVKHYYTYVALSEMKIKKIEGRRLEPM